MKLWATWTRLLLVVGLVSTSCKASELTQIVVLVETDYRVPAELTRVEIVASSGPDTEVTSALLVGDRAPSFPLSLTYVPDGAPDASLTVSVTGYDIEDRALVSQTRSTTFVPGASLTLRIDLSRTCADVTCIEPNTCEAGRIEGRCGPQMIASETLPPFVDGQPSGGTELCNGRDDDGDGLVDNGFDFESDAAHCGGCFAGCPAPDPGEGGVAACLGGACGLACPNDSADCDGDTANGCERSIRTGADCGGCDAACPPGMPVCDDIDGTQSCVTGCSGGEELCGTSCADLSTDVSHCGACGDECPDAGLGFEACVDGVCVPECEEAAHSCGELCVSNDSVDSCGERCGMACPPSGGGLMEPAVCERQECFLDCPVTRFDCDLDPSNGCEAYLTSRPGRVGLDADGNCGGCGVRCGAGACIDSACSLTVVDFELGPRHGCAELSDGSFWCWGANEAGQVGVAPSESEPTPVGLGFSSTTSGEQRDVAALDDDASYFSFSLFVPGVGLLRRADVIGRSPVDGTTGVPTAPVSLVNGGNVVAVDRGVGFSHATIGTELRGWGQDASDTFTPFCGTSGCPTLPGSTPLPVAIRSHSDPSARIARGGNTTCTNLLPPAAPTQLQCWGTATAPDRVYIGDGSDTGSTALVTINPVDAAFVDGSGYGVDLAEEVGCATFQVGGGAPRPYCWGEWGGCGPFGLAPTPVPGTLAQNPSGLSVGDTTACIVSREDGSLVCWGRDLVDGSCDGAPVYARPEFTGIQKVQVSRDFACVLLGMGAAGSSRLGAPGSLWCWGNNAQGQLGVGSYVDDDLWAPAGGVRVSMRAVAAGACVQVFLLATVASVAAQEASESDIARARAQYRVGVELVTDENWLEAEAAFQRAYALYPEPLIIFNLASVRERLGRLLEARASYEEFLERAGDEHQSYVEVAQGELGSIAERIGRIELRIRGLETNDIVLLDGDAVESTEGVEVDPGRHVVTIRRGTAQVARARVRVEPGATAVAELAVVNPERVVRVDEGGANGVLIGILTAVGVLAVAGGVILAVVLTSGEDPFMGNVEPGVVPIGLRWGP